MGRPPDTGYLRESGIGGRATHKMGQYVKTVLETNGTLRRGSGWTGDTSSLGAENENEMSAWFNLRRWAGR